MENSRQSIPEFWQPTSTAPVPPLGFPQPKRILIAKPGLDGHDRGAKYVAQVLRDAGFEVSYTGIRRTPRQIVAAGIFRQVDAIGLSLLSGAHNFLFAQVVEALKERDASHIYLFGGGVIPAKDVDFLMSLGVQAVFTPGASAAEIVAAFERVLGGAKITVANTDVAQV
ncbi:MAG: cobalamin B12-binding domain-containing protein [Planctomycetia bacterium]|nr:cobalamin B12-binding domain-containing protein [Planctomycetia bacterium]